RQRGVGAIEPGAAEHVVLVEDRNLLDLEVLGEVLDPGLSLGRIARPDVDHVLELRIAQEAGAREWADEWYLGGGCDGHCRIGGWRTDGADERKYPLFLDKLLGRGDRAVGLVAVVQAHKLEPAPVDATARVGLI